jgi:uncharacterized membrane protein YdjX (TVP38/TMEM64 family)
MPSRPFARPSRLQIVLAIVALLILALLGGLILHEVGLTGLKSAMRRVADACAGVPPPVFVLAVTFLPYVGVPTSALYIVAGGAYGHWPALGWSWLGLLLNMIVGYGIGSWLRGPISRRLERRGYRLPEVPPNEHWRLILLIRILPGPPLVVQNLLLAVAGVPFLTYLLVSMPAQMLFVLGFVFSGDALFKGSTGLLITGVCLLVALTLLAHIAKTIYDKHRRAASLPPAEKPPLP